MVGKRKGKRPHRPIRSSLLIVTTGTVTERLYLEQLKQRYREQTTDPMRIVIQTSSLSPEATVSTYKRRNRDQEYDEIWFIVDQDEYNLERFVNLCTQYGFKGVISSPCFEVWLVAHYEQVGNVQTPQEIQRRYRLLAHLEQKNQKTIPRDFPWNQMGKACTRSRLRLTDEPGINEIPSAPASAMPHLLRRLGLAD